ncbi:MAG: AAA family ATPase [Candidatus Sumerlaeia bacterium]
MPLPLADAARSVREAIKNATRGLVEREALADLIILSAVAAEHLLVVGPPGTGKSAVVRRVAQAIGGRYFEYLLGRFTEPSEIFGPIDLRKLRTGTVETETTGMLPEAEVAFLDEVFLGSTAVLNTLLSVLNERTFRRGHTSLRCPLRVCVGATNVLPDEESLAAFADRFLVHVFVEPVPDYMLEDLLDGGRGINDDDECPAQSSLEQLDLLTTAAAAADLSPVRNDLAHGLRLLRKAGLQLSDRRMVKAQRLIAAAAVLAGRPDPTPADLWPLIDVIPTREGQALGREVLSSMLNRSENQTLVAAAEEASAGPQARAGRIAEQAELLLAGEPDESMRENRLLQLEALGREIDAGFCEETMPPALKSLRDRIAQATAVA